MVEEKQLSSSCAEDFSRLQVARLKILFLVVHCSSETSERSRTVIIDSDAGVPEPSDPQRHSPGYVVLGC